MGYRVFMDIEALNSDDWVRREVIALSKIILILSQ